MELNWTAIIQTAITAAIMGGTQFITARYLGRMLDKWDRIMRQKEPKSVDKDS